MSKQRRPGTRIRDDIVEVLGVLVLSVTAVATAWCGFESSKWSGAMSVAFSEASSARVQAVDLEGAARDERGFDLAIYTQWALADAQGNTAIADYVEERFTPGFSRAFDSWIDEGRPTNSPLSHPDYVLAGSVAAERLSDVADERFSDALANAEVSDQYTLLTVLFALVLFLAAMAQRKFIEWGRRVLLGLAGVVLLFGIISLATFPIQI